MRKFEVKENTHIVIKVEDVANYLDKYEKAFLEHILNKLQHQRQQNNKKLNSYLIVNTDEPYANEIREVIKKGEELKWLRPNN